MNLDINDLTLKQIKEIQGLVCVPSEIREIKPFVKEAHAMLGKRCLVRTYSAGVHIGDVVWINPENSMEVKLESWEVGQMNGGN